ncbi:MAG TPA: FKBP-type peptidyl-prolyl cis-trans isomerase [Pseudolysinimonas sp.]|nr:FKBP-type peptidyl-prolyl cis-trans isomerase [Pseudolysinimonas sp.]
MLRTRAFVAALTISVLGISLAACSSGAPDPSSSASSAATACSPAGEASKSIAVTGKVGTAPTVTIPFPVSTDITERTVTVKGSGTAAKAGDKVRTQFTIYNATTGEVLTSTGYGEGTALTLSLDEQTLAGFTKALLCAKPGSRITAVIPPADAFGAQGYSGDEFSISGKDSVVFVADVLKPLPPLTPKAWKDNVPTVTYTGDVPTVTLPQTPAPTDLLRKVLTKGTGATVGASDTVTLDYHGISWTTGEVFDESFTKKPISLTASSFVPGFSAAIIGQKVGTTLLVSIPPVDGYGVDPAAHELGGQTLVFLVKIEKTAKAG